MAAFANVLTALDMTEMDQVILRTLKSMSASLKMEHIYFTHIVPDFSFPKEDELDFKKKFAPDKPLDEIVREGLHQTVEGFFPKGNTPDWELLVVEGKAYHQLLHWTEVKNPDLVVVGKKKESQGSGITAKRLARNIKKAGILLINDEAPKEIQKVVVPVDYSENSARALKTAMEWRRQNPNLEVTAIYVIDYPPTGFYLNKEEFVGFNKMLLDTAQKSFKKFLDEHQIPKDLLTFKVLENSWHNIAGAIKGHVQENTYDMLLIGAQGHSGFESFLFGSVTEHIVNEVSNLPVMVVR